MTIGLPLPDALVTAVAEREEELLAAYRARLRDDGSALVRTAESADQAMAQARSILRALTQRMRRPEEAQDEDDAVELSRRIGTDRAASRVHPTESLSAASALMQSVTARLVDLCDELELDAVVFGAASSLLTDIVLRRLRDGAGAYTGFLLTEVQRANEHERRRIARELHDRVSHGLTAAHRQVELAQMYAETDRARARDRLDTAVVAVAHAIDTTRQVADGLRMGPLRGPLKVALADSVRALSPVGLDVTVEVHGDEVWVPGAVRTEVLLILREAVHNVVRHSGAGRLRVDVELAPHELRATVADDGRGLPTGTDGADGADGRTGSRGGIGLQSMRERAELLGGQVRTTSPRGGGTRVHLVAPLPGFVDVTG